MKLTISLQVTLDGVAQANGGNNEEMDPGFTRGGWALPLNDNEAARYILDTWRRPDAFLLGRKTFGLFETYWGARGEDGGFGEAMSSKPKYLVSTTVTDPTWEQTTVISGDVAAQVRELKAQPGGELLVVGSAALAQWLLENELVDELNLVQFPVIVGEGRRLFPQSGLDFGLELLDSAVFGTGIVALTYRVGGRPAYA
ncbi:dihydrofolate reductase [Arthrobacter stackebrandtii]|uniref:Dihydrofolate reductase n=1 Tax=Arthrobacter stackebrandtii TaxID=272161 RepID=A0ABS4Z0T3_9MICC|nr:dihydrofolate reductase family protein [Arthrobacter stackebrandtii]MBP2414662.1 dihydrofolate reductase [Arthrobacter stackebrandtii]PYH01756.1 deaminase [Arthrobacter stackebrandtii]